MLEFFKIPFYLQKIESLSHILLFVNALIIISILTLGVLVKKYRKPVVSHSI